MKLSPGEYVEWICKPHMGNPVRATGRIIKIYHTIVGACTNKEVAQIYIHSYYPFKRKRTTVSLDKLKRI